MPQQASTVKIDNTSLRSKQKCKTLAMADHAVASVAAVGTQLPAASADGIATTFNKTSDTGSGLTTPQWTAFPHSARAARERPVSQNAMLTSAIHLDVVSRQRKHLWVRMTKGGLLLEQPLTTPPRVNLDPWCFVKGEFIIKQRDRDDPKRLKRKLEIQNIMLETCWQSEYSSEELEDVWGEGEPIVPYDDGGIPDLSYQEIYRFQVPFWIQKAIDLKNEQRRL